MRLTKKRKRLLYTAIAALCVIIVGAFFYHTVEGWNWLDSTYFTVITMATVGYGDHVPVTPLGKLFTIGFVIVGMAIMISFIDAVAHIRVSQHVEEMMYKLKIKKDEEDVQITVKEKN